MEDFDIRWNAVAAGVLGFLIAYLFDWASLKGIPGLKQTIGGIVLVIHGYALYTACCGVARFSLPFPLLWIGLVLLPLSFLLIVYSLFIEIPFAKTYTKKGNTGQLVTTGTYALVRHPGVIWYPIFLLSLFFATGSITLLFAAPMWVFMNILYVVIQERFFFERMFPGYQEYRRQTPMLVPTMNSITKCLSTIKPKVALK